ncbi:sensor histidine kinase [Fusibacter ferrireducens]|uniref:Oxygen sensor histidine kinase NreB n=1 Tax=Fusibacter ferrireducens TaxID=2785058 RepID=A0ABR9ZZ01_9FIRM|nr:sensor histidine kinase [Fusibacter ferrireducens]MBF4694819.1 sensor histidine kinase [Fusibacter ferrireducens]
MKNFIEIKELDQIINKTAVSIEDGKKEIFEISEKTRQDYNHYEQELLNIKTKLTLIVNEIDKVEIKAKMAKNMIATINAHFDEFTEKDIKDAYELSQKVQIELSVKRQEERELQERKMELDRLLITSKDVMKRSEVLETKVSVALDYLTNSIFEQVEDHKHKKEVSLKIIEAQENEKKRISRDIHDGPAQSLANIIFKAEYLSKIIDVAPHKAKKEISELQEDIRNTLKDIRKIIYDLMPMSLDDLGLIPTLNKLISNLLEGHALQIEMKLKNRIPINDPLINLTVFRVVQESFNNMVKHSKCKNALLIIDCTERQIEVEIIDDGIGFDAQEMLLKPSGYGLYNMRERIEMLNGTFSLKSQIGKGTKIKIVIPNKIS